MGCGWEPQTLEEGQPDAKACLRVTLWLPWSLRWEKIHLTENFPPTYRYVSLPPDAAVGPMSQSLGYSPLFLSRPKASFIVNGYRGCCGEVSPSQPVVL